MAWNQTAQMNIQRHVHCNTMIGEIQHNVIRGRVIQCFDTFFHVFGNTVLFRRDIFIPLPIFFLDIWYDIDVYLAPLMLGLKNGCQNQVLKQKRSQCSLSYFYNNFYNYFYIKTRRSNWYEVKLRSFLHFDTGISIILSLRFVTLLYQHFSVHIPPPPPPPPLNLLHYSPDPFHLLTIS